MKKIAILFAFFILAKPVLPFLEYQLHYDYIIKELCENKNKPELKCNGKCYLAKQLAKAAEQENNDKNTANTHKKNIEILFIEPIKTICSCFYIEQISKNNSTIYHNLYSYNRVNLTFHPPSFLI